MSDERYKRPHITLDLGFKSDIRLNEYGEEEDFGCEEVVPYESLVPDTHHYLFGFLNADLESAGIYIRKAVETGDRDYVDKAMDILRDSHPYFSRFKEHVDAYLHRSLAGEAWRNNAVADPAALLESFGVTYGWYLDPDSWLHPLSIGNTESLLYAQEDLKRRVVLLLSDENEELARMPQQARVGLYYPVCKDSLSTPPFSPLLSSIPRQDVIPVLDSFRTLQTRMDFDEDLQASYFEAVGELCSDEKALPDILRDAARDASEADGDAVGVNYVAEYLEEILALETRNMFFEGVRVRRCRRCGEYFPVTEESSEYCQVRDKEGGSSCFLIERKAALKPEIDKIYHRAYKTHHDRITFGHEAKEDVDRWRKEARTMQSKVYEDSSFSPEDYRKVIMMPADEMHELVAVGMESLSGSGDVVPEKAACEAPSGRPAELKLVDRLDIGEGFWTEKYASDDYEVSVNSSGGVVTVIANPKKTWLPEIQMTGGTVTRIGFIGNDIFEENLAAYVDGLKGSEQMIEMLRKMFFQK